MPAQSPDQSAGVAWATVTAPGFGSALGWDQTAIETRVDPAQEQTQLGTKLSRSVPVGEDVSVTLASCPWASSRTTPRSRTAWSSAPRPAIHAPIFQLFQRDRHAGHRAAYECAGPHHAEVTIEISDLGLTRHGGRANAVAQRSLSAPKCTPGAKDADHTVIPVAALAGCKVRGERVNDFGGGVQRARGRMSSDV